VEALDCTGCVTELSSAEANAGMEDWEVADCAFSIFTAVQD